MNETTITVVGRLVADPVIRQTYAGSNVTTFRIRHQCSQEPAGTGEFEDGPTSYYNISAYKSLGANAAISLHRGEPVVVTGALEVSTFDRQDGSKGSAADITARQIGHDLSWGVSGFAKVSRQSVEGGGSDPLQSAIAAYAAMASGRFASTGPGREDGTTVPYGVVDEDGVIAEVGAEVEEGAAESAA
jgi:single stranded DNA-binding protein (ssb)